MEPFDDARPLEFSKEFVCPLCSQPLPSIDAIWSHLNDEHTPKEGQLSAPPALSALQSAPHHGRYHPDSAYIYGKAMNTLECLAAETAQYNQEIRQARQNNIYYPFADSGEWELGKFLCENLNKGQIT
ncbi:hypothetical protein JVU11DRAFT_10249 [Chiua virens]|nr:hypothetical protein JVU11DRAFT_10249 [Chiua virens]